MNRNFERKLFESKKAIRHFYAKNLVNEQKIFKGDLSFLKFHNLSNAYCFLGYEKNLTSKMQGEL